MFFFLPAWANTITSQVSAGTFHTLGLKSVGTVVAVDYNIYECDVKNCDLGEYTDPISPPRYFNGHEYGDPNISDTTSIQPTDYVVNNSDYYNTTASRHPGATEIAGDSIDQDYNGSDRPRIYSLAQTQISQLYVAIFGRASEGEMNTYWQTNQEDMVSTANVMLNTESAKNYFGTSMDDNQAFIEHIYKNTLGKTIIDDPDGIAYWVEDLCRGKSRGEVIVSIINAVQESVNASNAQVQFNNKVKV